MHRSRDDKNKAHALAAGVGRCNADRKLRNSRSMRTQLHRGAISDSQHDLSNFAQERTNAVALPLGYTKDTSLL